MEVSVFSSRGAVRPRPVAFREDGHVLLDFTVPAIMHLREVTEGSGGSDEELTQTVVNAVDE